VLRIIDPFSYLLDTSWMSYEISKAELSVVRRLED